MGSDIVRRKLSRMASASSQRPFPCTSRILEAAPQEYTRGCTEEYILPRIGAVLARRGADQTAVRQHGLSAARSSLESDTMAHLFDAELGRWLP